MSSSQRHTTASHSTPTNGKTNKITAASSAPPTMNGLRRPQRSLHVLSLIAPINGWMIRPVIGPAMLRIGRSCGLAPMNRKSGFTAENTIPKPKEFPKNPKVITRMFVRVSGGLCSRCCSTSMVVAVDSVDVIVAPGLRD